MKIITLLAIFCLFRTAYGYELYLYGEKPDLAKAIKKNALIDLEMARGEFSTFILRLPEAKNELPKNIKFNWKMPPDAPIVELNTFWLGVHKLSASSFKHSLPLKEAADITIPLDWMINKKITPPQENIPKTLLFLFEVQINEESHYGNFEGFLDFTLGKKNFSIPVKLTIHQTVLPAKFDLNTSFGFAPWEVLKKHYGVWDKNEMALYEKYLKEAAVHRIDLHKIYVKFPDPDASDLLTEGQQPDKSFIGQTKKLFEGTLSAQNKFQMGMTDLPVPEEYRTIKNNSKLPIMKIQQFWNKLDASVVLHKLQDKTFVYFIDEPKENELTKVGEDLRQIRLWAPHLRFLVTSHFKKSLDGAVNLWCINLFQWERPGQMNPDFYLKRQSTNGEDFWFYVGCNSHGCTGAENIENPDMVMDRPAAYQRAFPWMALRYGARGILYYDTVYGYAKGGANAPWKDQFFFTGYGEGNLFYPCTQQLGKCETPQVISSLRLKIIRDGLQDVQILKMAKDKGIKIDAWVNKAIKHSRSFLKDTKSYEDIKREALRAMDLK